MFFQEWVGAQLFPWWEQEEMRVQGRESTEERRRGGNNTDLIESACPSAKRKGTAAPVTLK